MQAVFIQYIYLILIILTLVMVARKLNIAYPIVLVLGGLVLGLTTEFSRITIDPEAVFFIFLPPLLYEAAWQTSWKEFWKWRRVIMSFCFKLGNPRFYIGLRLFAGRHCVAAGCYFGYNGHAYGKSV